MASFLDQANNCSVAKIVNTIDFSF